MKKQLLPFVAKFTISILILYGLHLFILHLADIPANYSLLTASYLVNFFLALAIVISIIHYIDKLKNYIGFLFMAGSFLKFAVFFIWFYPIFKADATIDRIEFACFFVPYIFCLLFETKKLSNVLNKG